MAEIIELNLKEEEVKKIKNFFKSNAVKVGRQSAWSYIIMVGEVIYYKDNKLYRCKYDDNYGYVNRWEEMKDQRVIGRWWTRLDNVLFFNKEEFYKEFPYSGIEDIVKKAESFANSNYSLEAWNEIVRARYMVDYLKAPYVEQLYKSCNQIFNNFANGLDRPDIFKVFRTGKNMSEITRMPNWLWKALTDYDEDVYAEFGTWYRVSIKQGHPLTLHDVETLKNRIPSLGKSTISKFRTILRQAVDEDGKCLFTTQTLINYLERVDVYQAIAPLDAIEILKDYVSMCKKMGVKPITDSNSLKREHDVMVRLYNQEAHDRITKKQQEGFKKMYSKLSKYEYENKDLIVVIPKEPADLVNEGRNNRNCVACYDDGYARGDSEIFFIRHKENKDRSYITVQTYDGGENIQQAYYACNMPITKSSDKKFIEEWLKHNKEINERRGDSSF